MITTLLSTAGVLRLTLSLACASFISIRGYRSRSLSTSGAQSALFVGAVTMMAGTRFCAILIAFFISSSKLTKLKQETKRRLEADFKHGGYRDVWQVMANGLFGTLICILYMALVGYQESFVDFDTQPLASFLFLAFLGHYACCNGDTWASEVGILSESDPYLITTFKKVPKGTNGGISALGLMASVGGGLFLGIISALVTAITHKSRSWVQLIQIDIIFLGAFAGIFGSLIDSLLGATLQYSGFDDRTQKVVNDAPSSAEDKEKIKHICGSGLLNNNQVNFLAGVVTGIATGALGLYIC